MPCFKLAATILLAGILLLRVAHAAVAPEPENIATFSVVAYDPATGEVGVAVQSRFFCVGSVVPWCKAGVGAVATQAFGQPEYGRMGIDLLEDGGSPAEALISLLNFDDKANQRQIGIVSAIPGKVWPEPGDPTVEPVALKKDAGTISGTSDVLGHRSATYTGLECLNWAGGIAAVAPDGVVYAVQGNILAGEQVVQAMAAAMDDPGSLAQYLPEQYAYSAAGRALNTQDFAGRLLGALIAGELAGGDSRGMQSAALKVSQAGAGYGGYNDVKYDLRVDDATDPFVELARLLNLARPIVMANEAYTKLNADDMPGAVALFEQLVQLDAGDANAHYNLACALSRSGELDRAMEELKAALAIDPKMQAAAQTDTDLTNLHEREDFKALVGEVSPAL